MDDKKYIYFLIYLINISFIFVLFIYLYYFCFLYGICISFFIIYITQIFNIFIYIKNMKENNDNTDNEKNNEDNINNDDKNSINVNDEKMVNKINENKDNENFDDMIKKMNFFSYGVISSALVTFFISGGINSFLFTIIFFLVLNNNLLILEEKNIYIYHAFINFCYFVLSLRANFFNLSYFLIFFLHLQTISYKNLSFFLLVLNIFFFIDFNYLNLILLILSSSSLLSSYMEKKEDKIKDMHFILNYLILSTLFIQSKGYEFTELLIIYISTLFQIISILIIKREFFKKTIIFILSIAYCLCFEHFFIANKYYNQKGIWINILYYLFIIF